MIEQVMMTSSDEDEQNWQLSFEFSPSARVESCDFELVLRSFRDSSEAERYLQNLAYSRRRRYNLRMGINTTNLNEKNGHGYFCMLIPLLPF